MSEEGSKESSPAPEPVPEPAVVETKEEDAVVEEGDKEKTPEKEVPMEEEEKSEKVDMVTVLEDLFKNRYTEEDEGYTKTIERETQIIAPPIIADWRYSYNTRDRERGDKGRDDRRRDDKKKDDHRDHKERSKSPHHEAVKIPNCYYQFFY